MGKTIIVSNRLPVSVDKIDNRLVFKPSVGGLATGLNSIVNKKDNLWIGWPGSYSYNEAEKTIIRKKLSENNMIPIFLTKDHIEKYYNGFSNATLWPIFHYFTQYAVYDDDLWISYQEVNTIFGDIVIRNLSEGDTIWIHDYQLLLLPLILRKKLCNATIGFFQHIPFPSYEIFRLLPWRCDILQGMLGSDLIGFHTYDDVRHFLSATSRLIGIENTTRQMFVEDRLVEVDAFPMGIDYNKYNSSKDSLKVKEKIAKFKKSFGDTKLILSIDRLDYTKGIKQRLEAFDMLLDAFPSYRCKVSLVLVVVPSRTKVTDYKHFKEEIDGMVGYLNGKYSRVNWTPVHYFYRDFSFEGICGMYHCCDIALITPIRDGMNLVSKEYIASRDEQGGVLILSEMAGASKELTECIIVNPNDSKSLVKAIDDGLNMPLSDQITVNRDMQERLKNHDIYEWGTLFLDELIAVKRNQSNRKQNYLLNANSKKSIFSKYRKSKSRILLLDYDGTLMPFYSNPSRAYPDPEIKNILRKLTNDSSNKVVIISGRRKEELDLWLKDINFIDIVAEHGAWYKKEDVSNNWSSLREVSNDWKQGIKSLLKGYVAKTPGSFIEEKDHSLAWHYRKTDFELGKMRTEELITNLGYLSARSDIQIMRGHRVVEIKNSSINKGISANQWLSNTIYEFILCVGDDITDEDMFNVIPDYGYTIKVGNGISKAKWYVENYKAIRLLLKEMIE